jgi:hypothetical protein
MYNTLLLDQTAWDLVLDSSGNIALAAPPYALAQDVASAVRLFLGELWYDVTKGVPYFQEVLGYLPPANLLRTYLENAALSVPGVVTAQCILQPLTNRQVTGQIRFTDESGATDAVNF